MDYAAKAKELREAIFNHAESGHGGPCLRSGPLDKMLEEWLRLNCAPQVPSYPYGARVLAEDQTGNGRHLVEKPMPAVSVNVGKWEGVRYVTAEGDDLADWKPDPTTGSASLTEIAKALATGQEAKLAAGIKITPELVEGLRKAMTDSLIYGTGYIGMADGNLKALAASDVLDDCAPPSHTHGFTDPFGDHIGFTQEERLHSVTTSWPTPAPSDPKRGDIYVDHVGLPSVWAGKSLGWQRAPIGDHQPSHTHQYTYKGMTRMEMLENMRKIRGLKPKPD